MMLRASFTSKYFPKRESKSSSSNDDGKQRSRISCSIQRATHSQARWSTSFRRVIRLTHALLMTHFGFLNFLSSSCSGFDFDFGFFNGDVHSIYYGGGILWNPEDAESECSHMEEAFRMEAMEAKNQKVAKKKFHVRDFGFLPPLPPYENLPPYVSIQIPPFHQN